MRQKLNVALNKKESDFKSKANEILEGLAEKEFQKYEGCKVVPPDSKHVAEALLDLSEQEQDFLYNRFVIGHSWDRTLAIMEISPSRANAICEKIFAKLSEKLPPFVQSVWRDNLVDEVLDLVKSGELENPKSSVWEDIERFSKPPYVSSKKMRNLIESEEIIPLEDLGLSGKVMKILRRNRVCTVNQLAKMWQKAQEDEEYLVYIKGLGYIGMDEINEKMRQYGYKDFILPVKLFYPRQ